MIRKLVQNDYFLALPPGKYKAKAYQSFTEYSHFFYLSQKISTDG